VYTLRRSHAVSNAPPCGGPELLVGGRRKRMEQQSEVAGILQEVYSSAVFATSSRWISRAAVRPVSKAPA
jgi:hypothetical protein